MEKAIQIVECPRDAMQGWPHPISTADKVKYLNALLKVGFHSLDFGSFVSPKAIPQMADTAEVLAQLDLSQTKTELLAIVANVRGAETAASHTPIRYLGFPFSISETFQQRNTNSSILQSVETVKAIGDICAKQNKSLVVYFSMGFGNPYGDPYHADILMDWVDKLSKENVQVFSVADTVGLATPELVSNIMNDVMKQYSNLEIGVHLHSTYENMTGKLSAALNAGVRRFDGAMKGIGGCPMSGNELVGNMDTEVMINFFESEGFDTGLNKEHLSNAAILSGEIFN
jgi:hydroxymethylglutaryl-CoA lyase